ncbi:MAG: hypothetical protein ACYTBP_13035 [Planctomycetota bacterium]|jgi:hypothetical protein
MKILAKILVVSFMIGLLAIVAIATTDTANQTVSITFSEISEVAVSGNPGLITIAAPATPGDLPADQSESTTTMAWTSNVAAAQTRKISGQIDALFSGIDLYGTVAAAGGAAGTSAGETKFTAATTDYDFVTAIGNTNTSAQTITYRANVTAMVAPYTNTQNTVTWTLTEDS